MKPWDLSNWGLNKEDIQQNQNELSTNENETQKNMDKTDSMAER